MVNVGRHPVRSIAAVPSGRRIPARRAAVILAAACTATLLSWALLTSTAFGNTRPAHAAGRPGDPVVGDPASSQPAPDPGAAPPVPESSPAPVGRSTTRHARSVPPGNTMGDSTVDAPQAGPAQDPVAVGSDDLGSHIGVPTARPASSRGPQRAVPGATLASPSPGPSGAGSGGPRSGAEPGLNLGFAADPGDALRAPDAGSQPSLAPLAGTPPAPMAEQQPDPWSFLHSAATGEWLFLIGFLSLLLSIGGLVAVGIYRRRW